MNKGVVLTDEFLDADDVMPTEGDETDIISPAGYDIPREVKVQTTETGDILFRFIYTDSEIASTNETPLDDKTDIQTRRGEHSGKIMFLKTPAGKSVVLSVAERLKAVAPRQKRKHQELNFLLLSNILRKKQDELQPT